MADVKSDDAGQCVLTRKCSSYLCSDEMPCENLSKAADSMHGGMIEKGRGPMSAATPKRKVAKKAAAKKKAPAKKKVAKKASIKKAAAKKAAPKVSAKQVSQQKKIAEQVKTVSKEIDRIEREGQKMLKQAEKRYNSTIKSLKGERAKLEKQAGTLATKGELAFEDVRKGVDAAYKDLAKAVKQAYKHFT